MEYPFQKEQKQALLLREWLTLAFFSALIFSIIILSWLNDQHTKNLILATKVEGLRVYIDGEVEHPGVYIFKEGTTLLEAASLAGLKDSSRIDPIPQKPVKDGDRLKIKAQKMITVQLSYPEGGFEALTMPSGSKIEDLEKKMLPSRYRVNWQNKRRKLLRDGEIVPVCKKN